jgi:outer membrane lipoprotein
MRGAHGWTAILALTVAALAAGCAAKHFDLTGVDRELTPKDALADIGAARERTVQWGGTVIAAVNLKDRTQIEVLAYPLDRSGRPVVQDPPYGRVLLYRDGYLETADYSAGREVTAVGPVTGLTEGKVGEAPMTYAVMQAAQIHLWPKRVPGRDEPRFHFGIGVGIIR